MLPEEIKTCERCIHSITFFGAHRGGVYCQKGTGPRVLWNLNVATHCANYTPDNGESHKQLFELYMYPNLLSKQELENKFNKQSSL